MRSMPIHVRPKKCSLARQARRATILLAAAALAAGVSEARAQQRMPTADEARSRDEPKAPAPHAEGEYGGVVPGKSPFRKRRRDTMTWIGFQPRADGSSLLFIQLTNELSYEQEVDKGFLVIRLAGAKYGDKNSRRRLDVRFFDTLLAQVTSKRVPARRAREAGKGGKARPAQRAGIEVRVEFKDRKDARPGTASLRTDKDGFSYLLFEFGPPAQTGGASPGDPEGGPASDPE